MHVCEVHVGGAGLKGGGSWGGYRLGLCDRAAQGVGGFGETEETGESGWNGWGECVGDFWLGVLCFSILLYKQLDLGSRTDGFFDVHQWRIGWNGLPRPNDALTRQDLPAQSGSCVQTQGDGFGPVGLTIDFNQGAAGAIGFAQCVFLGFAVVEHAPDLANVLVAGFWACDGVFVNVEDPQIHQAHGLPVNSLCIP